MDYSLIIKEIIGLVVVAAVIIGGCFFAYKKWNFKEAQTGWKKWVKRGIKAVVFCTAAYVVVYFVIVIGLAIEIHHLNQELARMNQLMGEWEVGTAADDDTAGWYQDTDDTTAQLWNSQATEDKKEEKQWYLDMIKGNLDTVAEADIIVDRDEAQDADNGKETDSSEAADTGKGSDAFSQSELNRTILRERPVLSGESLWSIAQEVYGDHYKWRQIYEANTALLGDNPSLIYKGQYLILPEDDNNSYTDYERCYRDTVAAAFDWEGTPEYIDPDCGYEIINCVFYYTLPEGEGETFKICYPKLISHNGKDVSAVNAGIRERAMKYVDQMLINRTEDLTEALKTDERYHISWVRSEVNYRITYLDENMISVVFQDYLFLGSIYAEDIELRAYVADINTGIQYKNQELLQNLDDMEIAQAIHEDLLLQDKDDESVLEVVKLVLTPELICNALQTNGNIDNRYFINTFLTEDGVGFAFSYRVGQEIDGNYRILRGWRKIILPKEQIEDYQTDAVIWKYHSKE